MYMTRQFVWFAVLGLFIITINLIQADEHNHVVSIHLHTPSFIT